jgi:predicted aspartyl protease
MRGRVGMGREVLLTISVSGPSGERTEREAVVDTGFTGALCLGAEEIETLGCASWAGGTQCLRTGGRWRRATIAVVCSGMAGSGGCRGSLPRAARS